ncbi:MAG: SPOR domain-containing protein [Myxococcaceae bacterium]|nr:SPOR domain-containing protein [Myxococcaceae bacterium]MBH2006309.1 SPOR domain-containing protein [Myxococcaceae bacterium]
MIRLISIVTGLGLMFGMGFWVGRISDILPEMDSEVPLELRDKTFKEVKKRLELTYYSELMKKPEQTEILPLEPEESKGAAAPEPVPVEANTAPSKATPDKMAAALAHVLGDETPASVQKVVDEALPSGTGSAFAIQIASFPNRENATELVSRLQKKGYRAKLVQADIPERGQVFRVRIHGFQTREEADSYRAQNGLEGIVVAQ